MLQRTVDFDVEIKQDIIKASSVFFVLEKGEQIDLHIQASRLPFILKKDYFWIIVFVLAVVLLLLPAINFIRSLF